MFAIFEILEDREGTRLVVQAEDELLAYFDEHEEVRQQMHLQIALAEQAVERLSEAEAGLTLGHLETRAGRPEIARAAFIRGARIFSSEGIASAEAEAWTGLADLERRLGHFDEAVAAFERGLAVSREAGLGLAEAQALTSLGLAEMARGTGAGREFEEARALVPAGGDARVDGGLLRGPGRSAVSLAVGTKRQNSTARRRPRSPGPIF